MSSLPDALSYEIVFGIPVSEIFAGLRESIEPVLKIRLTDLETTLQKDLPTAKDKRFIERKLLWLQHRVAEARLRANGDLPLASR